MNKTIIKLLQTATPQEKRRCLLLAIMMLGGSILDVASLGAIVPFIVSLAKPDIIQTNKIIQSFHRYLGNGSEQNFILYLSFVVLVAVAIKNAYNLTSLYIQNRFLAKSLQRMSTKLFRTYLYKPYHFHLQKNTAQLIRNLDLVNSVINGIAVPFILILTESAVIAAIVIVLLITMPNETLATAFSISIFMFLFHFVFKGKLFRLGTKITLHGGMVRLHTNQGLGSIKETKVLGKESFFEKNFSFHFDEMSNAYYQSQILVQVPKYLFETIAVSMVILILVLSRSRGYETERAFVTLSCFGLATIRILPSLSRISTSLSTIRFYIPAFEEIYTDLAEQKVNLNIKNLDSQNKITFNKEIRIDSVTFNYEGSCINAIDKLSISIPKNKTVAFVGQSGAGKTTLADLILGLHVPQLGKIMSDNLDIQSNLQAWQKRIGYIPQGIYLTDDSIRRNVAFGLPDAEIEDERVWTSLRLAQLDEFINSLPLKLNTVVGERGVKISGGQKQRIGIARALYYNPDILVMDEATAALDQETEKAFMDSIRKLSGDRTIIIIAHRLSTVKDCDIIFFLKNGTLSAQGTFDELLQTSPEFRQMAGESQISECRK